MRSVSPFRRLIAAHWALGAVCALFLLAGALALDDYEYLYIYNEAGPRAIGNAALDYLAGDGEQAFDQLLFPHDRYYSALVEASVVLVDRLRGVNYPRTTYPDRRAFTHLIFLAGGVFGYLLVLRMFNNRPLALVAMVLFLLHPNIYGSSFTDSRDISFLAAFMASLYLVHRAFRRDTLGAFLLCGVGVGLLMNLRIMGIVLFAAVLLLRALDMGRGEGGRRTLLTGGAFALAVILTYYASLPALWTDPIGRFADMVRTLNAHPNIAFNLFRGEVPVLPRWAAVRLRARVGGDHDAARHAPAGLHRGRRAGMARAAPPARHPPQRPAAFRHPVGVLARGRDGRRRCPGEQRLLELAAPLLPVRTPAPAGNRRAAMAGVHPARTVAAGGGVRADGVAVAVTVVSMVRLYPYLNNHFNALADRTTPERLDSSYAFAHKERMSGKELIDDIISAHPSGNIFLSLDRIRYPLVNLPAADRARITETRDFRSGERNFYEIYTWGCSAPAPFTPISRSIRRYGVTMRCVVDPASWFGGYRRAARATEPLLRSRFDVHRVGDVLVYLRDGCSPDDMDARFLLRVHPVDPAALTDRPWEPPANHATFGFENRDFHFTRHGARIDGDCMAVVPLPDYPIARIETGQFTPERAEAALRAVAGDEPRARSRFDVWLAADGRGLIYVRDECAREDVEARFFLHAHPVDERDLLERRAEYGFNNLDFDFPEYGVHTGNGGCIATVPLPAYPIAAIHTGQFDGTGRLWTAEFALPEGE